MLKDFLRAMRVVMPPRWAIGIFVFAILLFVVAQLALMAWISWRMEISLFFDELPTFYSNLLPLGLGGYAVWRGVFFHPAGHSKYRQWLQTTPWCPSQPLPLGPAHLVWQDALVVALLTLAWTLPDDRWFLPLTFLGPYCAILTWANFRTGSDSAAYGSVATAAATLLAWGNYSLMLTIMLATYVWCYFGLRQSLRTFPWNDSPRWKMLTLEVQGKNKKTMTLWPLVHDPEYGSNQPWLTRKAAICLSLLAGWIAFCMSTCFLQNVAPFDARLFSQVLPRLLLLLGYGLAAGRLCAYCMKHWPPISLLGRLSTWRLIIPGYDRVLIAPLLTIAVGYAMPHLLIARSVPLPGVALLSVFTMLAISLGMGPNLSDWHLAGQHRLGSRRPGTGWEQLQ